jgi:hypothetical protein
MSTNVQGGSAAIYKFPARGRFAMNTQRDDTKVTALRAAEVAFGSGWYHDEAIEAERARKN